MKRPDFYFDTSVSTLQNQRYKAYTLQNYRDLPHVQRLTEEQHFALDVVGRVLPFRTNSYVVEELIDWDNIPYDPLFLLTFPQRDMLLPHHFDEMAAIVRSGAPREKVREVANRIRWELNPHPAGQMEYNIPSIDGEKLTDVQHKYRETVLFFPSQGQTCHAYCTFCFRWPLFVGMNELKFANRESDFLIQYLRRHPEVTDLIFTGGDPMIMGAKTLASYINPLIDADIPHLTTLRIGTKALGYWPYRFLTDPDADELLALLSRVVKSGTHLSIMANFNHHRELETDAARKAIVRLRETGAEIRTQSPLLAHINDRPEEWAHMWKEQVKQGCIPYYMFVARDTGAHDYFSIPLVEAWRIFQKAYRRTSGLSRTVRGPSMSTVWGKIQILGISEIRGKKVIALQFLQGRQPDWVLRPFFAEYDEKAVWFDELRPAFGEERFFFQ
jgi:KamA family protein